MRALQQSSRPPQTHRRRQATAHGLGLTRVPSPPPCMRRIGQTWSDPVKHLVHRSAGRAEHPAVARLDKQRCAQTPQPASPTTREQNILCGTAHSEVPAGDALLNDCIPACGFGQQLIQDLHMGT